MDKHFYAAVSLGLGLALGIVGDIFFYRRLIGLSFPLFVLLSIAAFFAFAALARKQPQARNLWLLIPLGFFAAMVAVRADMTLTFLNVLAVLTLGALLLHYFLLRDAFDSQSLTKHTFALIDAGFAVAFAPITQLMDAAGLLRRRSASGSRWFTAVLRGLVIALPVLIVFGLLLAAADPIFARYADRIIALFEVRDFEDAFNQAGVIAVLGWVGCGALAYAVLRRTDSSGAAAAAPSASGADESTPKDAPASSASSSAEAPAAPSKAGQGGFSLGIIESGIILALVDLMFGVFVLIQFAYFFGGQGNITVEGFTYADYARRGFFELVGVSTLTLGLMLWLDAVTKRQTGGQQTLFRVLSIGMVALVGIMLWSAHLRLTLYEEAYGFTHLRLYPHVFMLWLAALFGFFLLALFRVRRNIFALGTVVCAIGYLATLNLINPDYTIMQQNIARYRQGYNLDIGYLANVSADAIPALLPFYQQVDDRELRYGLGQWLVRQQAALDAQRVDAVFLSAHVGRDTAWAMLDAARDDLPEYDPDFFLPYTYEFDQSR